MARVVDLDAFLKERTKEPLTFRFGGKEYAAPPEIPWVAMQKAQEIHDSEVSIDAVGEVIALMLGKDAWDQMIADGLGFSAAVKILNELVEEAMQDMPNEVEGEADGLPKAVKLSRSVRRNSKKISG
jgi:hypothetical protein